MGDFISGLPPGTALDGLDIVPTTDVSDTSQNDSGKTKGYTWTIVLNWLSNQLGIFTSTVGQASTGSKVPTIQSGDASKFLNSLGAWAVPPNTTYSAMGAANSYASGLVPTGSSTHEENFLRKDGTFQNIIESDETDFDLIVAEDVIGTDSEFTLSASKFILTKVARKKAILNIYIEGVVVTTADTEMFKLTLTLPSAKITMKADHDESDGESAGFFHPKLEADYADYAPVTNPTIKVLDANRLVISPLHVGAIEAGATYKIGGQITVTLA